MVEVAEPVVNVVVKVTWAVTAFQLVWLGESTQVAAKYSKIVVAISTLTAALELGAIQAVMVVLEVLEVVTGRVLAAALVLVTFSAPKWFRVTKFVQY